jgi:hypothetical protein
MQKISASEAPDPPGGDFFVGGGPVIGLTTRDGAIIERVRTGTPARWASNRENPLALLECGG